jgi:hypothetical protein
VKKSIKRLRGISRPEQSIFTFPVQPGSPDMTIDCQDFGLPTFY